MRLPLWGVGFGIEDHGCGVRGLGLGLGYLVFTGLLKIRKAALGVQDGSDIRMQEDDSSHSCAVFVPHIVVKRIVW